MLTAWKPILMFRHWHISLNKRFVGIVQFLPHLTIDNNIHIFHLLWALIWKTLIGKYCEDSAWAECWKLYDKKKIKKFKMVLLGLPENNCHEYWFSSMWAMFKMESFKLYLTQIVTKSWNCKTDFANLYLKSCKMKYIYKIWLDNKTLWQDLPPISDMRPLSIDLKEEEKTIKKANVKKLNK